MTTDSRRPSWRDRLASVGFGIAVALLIGAAALTAWGLWAASTPVLSAEPPRQVADSSVTGTGWLVLIGSLGLLVGIFVDRRDPAEYSAAGGVTTLVAAVVGVVLAAVGWNLPARTEFLSTHLPATGQAPAVLLGWLLALAGCGTAFVLGWLMTVDGLPAPRGPVLVGALLGLIAVLVGVTTAVRLGDDARHIDATTAAALDAPVVPDRLGERRFTLAAPAGVERAVDGSPPWLAAGGAGFIMLRDGGVRAYDDAGNERWHYLRTGPDGMQTAAMSVYDDGRTVVLWYGDGAFGGQLVNRVLALDAMTGEILWQKDDPDHTYWYRPPTQLAGHPQFVIVEDGRLRWSRIDTRTGERSWSVDLPTGCPYEAAVTRARVSYVRGCADGADAVLTLVSLDAETGETVLEQEVGRRPLVEDPATPLQGAWEIDVTVDPGSDEALPFSDGAQWRTANLITGAVTPLDRQPVRFRGDPGPDLAVAAPYPAERIELHTGPSAVFRCAIPTDSWQGKPIAWLGEQAVLLTAPTDIAAFSRSDCAPGPRYSVTEGELVAVMPAPGVLLAVRVRDGHTFIDGYAAGR